MIKLNHPDVRESLKARLFELRTSYGQLLNTTTTCSYIHVMGTADELADNLAGKRGRDPAKGTALALQRLLISPWEARDIAFWTTPLGQVIAWWDGASYVSPLTGRVDRRKIVQGAGALTRPGSYKTKARLEREPDGNPTAASVAAYLQAVYPHTIPEATHG